MFRNLGQAPGNPASVVVLACVRAVFTMICGVCLACAAMPSQALSPMQADGASPAELAFRSLRYREAQALFSGELQRARDSGNLFLQARALQSLGNIDRVNGQYVAARTKLAEALALIQSHRTRKDKAQDVEESAAEIEARLVAQATHGTIVHDLGNAAWALGDFDSAQQLVATAFDGYYGAPAGSGEPDMEFDLGRIALSASKVDVAATFFSKSLKGYQERNSSMGQARAQLGLGDLAVAMDQHAAAHKHFSAALRSYHKLNRTREVAEATHRIAGLRSAARANASIVGTLPYRMVQSDVDHQIERDILTRVVSSAHEPTMMEDYEQAKLLRRLAIRVAQVHHNPDGVAQATTWLAHTYEWNREPDAALRLYRNALLQYKKIGDLTAQAALHDFMAGIEAERFRPLQALPHNAEAFRLYSLLGSVSMQSQAAHHLGDTHYALKRYDLAEKNFNDVVRLSRNNVQFQTGMSEAIQALGDVALARNRPALARKHYQQLLHNDEASQSDLEKARAHIILGNFERKVKHFSQARQHYALASSLLTVVDNSEGKASAQIGLGQLELAVGNYSVARQHFLDVQDTLDLKDISLSRVTSLIGLGAAELALGQRKEASEHLRAAHQLCPTIAQEGLNAPALVIGGDMDRGDTLQALSQRRCAEAARHISRLRSRPHKIRA
jgi:tetratricopeptide (TPR) repeat protein